eukprot:g2672.t1
MASRIRVLSERIMTHGLESAAGRLMENVQSRVMSAPGLISLETLKDRADHTKYIVLSEWESQEHYDKWLQSDTFKDAAAKLGGRD